MNTVLYDYQEKTAENIFNRMASGEIKGAYLGFDIGTGKTVTSLSVADRLYRNHMIKGLVVICPVSKVDDWTVDIHKEVPDIEMAFASSFQSAWRETNKAKSNAYHIYFIRNKNIRGLVQRMAFCCAIKRKTYNVL